MKPERFSTYTLDSHPQGKLIQRILASALDAVDPGQAVRNHARREGDRFSIGDRDYDLEQIRRVWVVGAGKAGVPMLQAINELLGDKLEDGVVVTKEGYAGGYSQIGPVRILEAGHPIPDSRSVQAAAEISHLLANCREDDLVICLISGGGSSLLVSPPDGVSLEDLQSLTSSLLASGAAIEEINTLRKHLDRLKGGQLARLSYPARIAALVLSDVVGDPLESIASGLTVPDSGTFQDALGVLERYDLVPSTPPPVLEHLRQGCTGQHPETPKPGDIIFKLIQNEIVGSNRLAAQAATRAAQQAGFNTLLLTTYLQGEAREAGRVLAAIARQVCSTSDPVAVPGCLVVGGETTVTVKGRGRGGRNQEMALSAVNQIRGLPGIILVTLATDGGDGPTDAAGAVVTGESFSRAKQAGLDLQASLDQNDSYTFFEGLGDLLKPGPTQTNVNDLAFLFAFPNSMEKH